MCVCVFSKYFFRSSSSAIPTSTAVTAATGQPPTIQLSEHKLRGYADTGGAFEKSQTRGRSQVTDLCTIKSSNIMEHIWENSSYWLEKLFKQKIDLKNEKNWSLGGNCCLQPEIWQPGRPGHVLWKKGMTSSATKMSIKKLVSGCWHETRISNANR